MNKVIIIGRLPQNPDVRYTPSGKAICSFAVIVQYRTKIREEADIIDCVAWDALAKNIGDRLVKGQKVAIEGRLHIRRLESTDGEKRKVTEVVVRDVEFMDESASGFDGENRTQEEENSFGQGVSG